MKKGELLIVDDNIPTGALNFLPRRDMLGEILLGFIRGVLGQVARRVCCDFLVV